jgi:hypothetical protein
LLAEQMSKYEEKVYSYRWDAPKANNTPGAIGINHFSEVSGECYFVCECEFMSDADSPDPLRVRQHGATDDAAGE